jgi:hypothetical protein
MASSAGRRSRTGPLVVVGALAALTLVARGRGYKLGTDTVVRCRQGHLFSTIWIPGVKLKALDLAWRGCSAVPLASTGASSFPSARQPSATRNASSLAHVATCDSPDP